MLSYLDEEWFGDVWTIPTGLPIHTMEAGTGLLRLWNAGRVMPGLITRRVFIVSTRTTAFFVFIGRMDNEFMDQPEQGLIYLR